MADTAQPAMVSRVALAICKSRLGGKGRANVTLGDIQDARAAIAAMREPTTEMADAAHEAMGRGTARPKRFSPSIADFVWRKMVDASLAELADG